MAADLSTMESLGVVVEQFGVDGVTAELRQLGATGEAQAKRVTEAFKVSAASTAQSIEQQTANLQASQARATAAAASQAQQAAIKAREAATAYVATLQAEFANDQARIREGVARGFLTAHEARDAGRDAAIAYNQGVLGAIDKAAAAGAFKTGNLPSVAGTAVYNELAGSLKNVNAVTERTGLNLNSVRASMVSMAQSAVQAVPGVGQLAGVLGQFALGAGPTIAILAGIAAVAFAWNAYHEAARKAKEEQDKLTESLHKWYLEQQAGPGGKLNAEIDATIAKIRELQKVLDTATTTGNPPLLEQLKAQFAGLLAGGDPLAQATAMANSIRRWFEGQVAAIKQGSAEVAAAMQKAHEDLLKESYDFAAAQGANLSTLISNRANTPQQAQDASALAERERAAIAALRREYAGLTTAQEQAFNLDLQVRALTTLKGIEDAAHSALMARLKDIENETAAAIHAIEDVTAAKLKEIDAGADAIRKGAVSNADTLRQSEQAAVLARSEGIAREYLATQFKAENDAIEANRTLSGIALRERLETIESVRLQGNEVIRLTTLQKQLAEANALAAKNQATTNKELSDGLKVYQATEAEASRLARTLKNDLLQSLIQFSTSGTQSFSGLVQVIEQGAIRMTEAIERSLDKQKELLLQATGENHKRIEALIEHLESLKRVAGLVGSAATGAQLGYSFGQQNPGSPGNAAAGGLATGALAGFQLAGPLGAAIGGLVGAASGLLGAADAHKAAARAIQDANKAIAQSIQSFGQTNSVQGALLQNTVQADSIRKAIAENLQAALKNDPKNPAGAFANANEQSLKLTEQQAANAKRIADDFWASIRAGLNSLNGPAGELQNTLSALAKTYVDNLKAAEALGGSTADITQLYLAQVEAAKRASAEAARRQQEDLDVRRITANGGTTRQIDDARFAYGQRREIADAQAANAPQELINQILEIQKLEQERRAADFAALQQAAQEDYRVRQLQASGHVEEANALQLQLAQQREYQDAVKAGLDATTLAALALAQAAESAAAAAKQAQDAQRALDDLRVRQLTAQGNTGGADDLRFQLQQQRELEDAIAAGRSQDYLDQLKSVQALEAQKRAADAAAAAASAIPGAVNNGARASGEATAIANAAHVLTEVTGNRMADYLASILIVEREQLNLWKGIGGTKTPTPFDRIDTGSLERWTGGGGGGQQQPATAVARGPVNIEINIHDVTGLATMTRSEKRALAHDLAKDVGEELANLEAQHRQVAGNPIVPGA